MKLGVLLGQESAGGQAAGQARRLGQLLCGHEVCSVIGWGGAEVGGTVLNVKPSFPDYLSRLHAAVDALADWEPYAYVILGGDGLAAYTAARLLARGINQPKLIGLAGGTANVGPIIAMTLEEFACRDADSLTFTSCDALEAFDGVTSLALGFNDLVLGNTLLSTVEGRVVTIDALLLAREGIKKAATPTSRIASNLRVVKNGRLVPLGLASPAQAVMSTLSMDRTYGRAVLGVLCCAACEPHAAALALLSSPVISFEPLKAGFREFLTVSQLLMLEGDELAISGLLPDICLVADGNPYLLHDGKLRVCIRKDCVMVVERGKHP